MRPYDLIATFVLTLSALSVSAGAFAQGSPVDKPPPDPWPRGVDLGDAQVLVYQPQINSWTGNQLDFRAALAIKLSGAKADSFGVIFATTRTQVDKVLRTVTFENLKISKIDFPTLPNRGAAYAAELQTQFVASIRTISLDRLDSSLALAGIKPPTVAVQNNPPRVIVSYSPAILVPIDETPVLKAVPSNPQFQRVINTRALILQGPGQNFFIHVYDGWLTSNSISGPWTQSFNLPPGIDGVAQTLAGSGAVDMLDGGAKASPKPSLANGVPAIYTSRVPAELIVFKGQPDFRPIVGTQLLWAANTTSDVLIDITNNHYYVLISGRWFDSGALTGPWTFVPNDALPADFARIPPQSLAGAVLPTVAGTPQAHEAAISNSIPQTATIPLAKGPTFAPNFDGPPQYLPIEGTSLSYVANSSEPVIQVAPNAYFAVVAGVWFTSAQVTGPWIIATSVPTVIYTIPPASPIYYVTYVRIYEATPQYVYVGYTPGYFGTVISPYGTVVYGTGYAYSPWIGTVWYPPPYTYGVAAAPIYNPWVGFTFGLAVGLATAAWMEPYWGGSFYSPAYWGAYPCCGSASANVYGHWGGAAYSGTRSWYAGGGVAGSTFSGSYATARGTTGNINAGRQYNAWTGNASRGYDRTFNTAAGGSGNVARGRTTTPTPVNIRPPTPCRAQRPMAAPTTAPVRPRLGRKATGTPAAVQSTTPTPARRPIGARRTAATIAMQTAAATPFRAQAEAGSNIPRAAGRTRGAVTPGLIRNRRRAAPAMIARAASRTVSVRVLAAAIEAAAVDCSVAAAAIASGAVAAGGEAGSGARVEASAGVDSGANVRITAIAPRLSAWHYHSTVRHHDRRWY